MECPAFLARCGTIAAVAAGVALTMVVADGAAQAQSFGCKVLLCSASVNPSWSGIPYCVPVMEKLFHDLAKGKGWPSCPEGGTSGPIQYQPLAPCPDGGVPGKPASVSSNNRFGNDQEEFEAASNGEYCKNGQGYGASITPRPRRDKPYFVMITPTGGSPAQLWFSLAGY